MSHFLGRLVWRKLAGNVQSDPHSGRILRAVSAEKTDEQNRKPANHSEEHVASSLLLVAFLLISAGCHSLKLARSG